MPTVYEKLITGRNTHRLVGTTSWYERLAASSNHNITHLALDINNLSGTGSLKICLCSTTGSPAKPDAILASVTVDISTILAGFGASDEFPYNNRKECIGVVFALSGTVAVTSGTVYAIVVNPIGTAAIWWRGWTSTANGGGSLFTNGVEWTGAGSWSSSSGDAFFECWDGSPSAPTVTTQAASAISALSVTLNGNRTALGDSGQLHQYGFCWGTSINPTVQSALATEETMLGETSSTGAYSSVVTGLTVGVTYHYRAYGVGMGGIAYGADTTFMLAYIYPVEVLLRLASSTRTFWAGPGSVYQAQLSLGGMSSTYVSPVGSREIPTAISTSPQNPKGTNLQPADYQRWLLSKSSSDIQVLTAIFGRFPTYDDWVKFMRSLSG